MDKQKIVEYIEENLSEKRFNHSLKVAEIAVEIAKRHGVDTEKCEIAGLLHDCMKENKSDNMLQYIDESDIILKEDFIKCKQIWHGFAAGEFIKQKFSIKDIDIINAVKYHTVGRVNMSDVEKTIFMADLTSNDRKHTDVQKMKQEIDKDFNDGFKYTLKKSICYLLSKDIFIYKQLIDAYNFYL
ncbi:MAG: bis(5'-nucleosyl)-tetraphosphatase (symmetrical) YqeK [Oscillospiraceae bacterium]